MEKPNCKIKFAEIGAKAGTVGAAFLAHPEKDKLLASGT